MSKPEYDEFVRTRLAAGDDANVITTEIENALEEQGDWGLWGDGQWRTNTVCARCGSPYSGICGGAHSPKPSPLGFGPCTTEPPIMANEFRRRRELAKADDAVGQPTDNPTLPRA